MGEYSLVIVIDFNEKGAMVSYPFLRLWEKFVMLCRLYIQSFETGREKILESEMKCIKCGFEYKEGRTCPKCGEPSIIINDDYYRRRREWEEKNAPKVEEQENDEEKKLLKINISRATWIKLGIAVVVVCLLFFAIKGVTFAIDEYQRTNRYKVIMYDVSDGISLVYSCDGAFAYELKDVFSGVEKDFMEKYCSSDGKVAAAVAYDDMDSRYILYISKDGESRIAYESEHAIHILRVNCDGSTVLQLNHYGNYDVIMSADIIELSERSDERLILESGGRFVQTGKDGVYCIVTSDGTVNLTENGRTVSYAYDVRLEQTVYALQDFYYLWDDKLYDSFGNIIDTDVDILLYVYGTDEMLYLKEGKMNFKDANGKEYIIEMDDVFAEIHAGDFINDLADEKCVMAFRAGDHLYIKGISNIWQIGIKNSEFIICDDKEIFLRLK